ncbi:hypothetical protein LINPERHAP1_LOCUS24987 [Linum perenne]
MVRHNHSRHMYLYSHVVQPKDFRQCSSPKRIREVMQSISPSRLQMLENYGLDSFAQITVIAIDSGVLTWVLKQYDYNSNSICLPTGLKKKLSVKDYRSVYPVPAGETTVPSLSSLPTQNFSEFIKQFNLVSLKGGYTVKSIGEALFDTEISDVDWFALFFLYLIGCLFCPTTSHTVDIRYITFVRGENLQNFKTYNWAKFGFANFKCGMFTTKGNMNIAADVHFLTVIYLVACNDFKGRGDEGCVLHHFTNEKVKDYTNAVVAKYCEVNKIFIDEVDKVEEDDVKEDVVAEDAVGEDAADAIARKKGKKVAADAVVRKGGKKVAASRQQNISVTEKGVSIADSPTKRSKKAVNVVATTKKRGRTENENVVGGSKKQHPDIVLPSAELFDSALASRTEAILLRANLARACDQCLHLIPEYKSSIAALDAFIDSSAEHGVSGVGGKTSDEVADNAINDVSADVTIDQASAPVLDASAPVLDATDVVPATDAAINDATDDDVVAQVNERTDDGEGTTKNDDEDEDSVDSDEDDADDKGGEKDDSNDDNADDKGGKKDDTNDDDTDDKGGDIPVGDDAIPEGNQETNVPFQTDASIPDESGKEPTNSAVEPHRISFVDYSALSKDDQEALDDIVSVIISDNDGKKANYSGDDLHCSPKSPPHVGIVPPKVSSPLETLVHAIQNEGSWRFNQ